MTLTSILVAPHKEATNPQTAVEIHPLVWVFTAISVRWRNTQENKHPFSRFVWCLLHLNPAILLLFSPQLLETKSTDRKQTLLHYISNVVKEKYQHVSLFYNELHYVEKAAAGTVTTAVPLVHLLGSQCFPTWTILRTKPGGFSVIYQCGSRANLGRALSASRLPGLARTAGIGAVSITAVTSPTW